MEYNRISENIHIIKEQRVKEELNLNSHSIAGIERNPVLKKFAAEGCENFYNYVDWLGLANDPNLIVLSSMHHYYYNADELKDIRTVINLMPLNQIKQVKGFLHSMYHLIPHKCYFIGCFADHKKHHSYIFKRNPLDKNPESVREGIRSRIPLLNIIFKIMDTRTDKYLSAKSLTLSFEDLGFNVLDMTELNGLTYFCVQKYSTIKKMS